MTEAVPLVAIIVLNYKLREKTLACLRSLAQLQYANYRLLVVDNDSQDGLAECVAAEFPHAQFIQTGTNGGYCGGNNRGLAAALEQGAEYALILNPDTLLINERLLVELVAYLQAHPRVGIVGPRVFLQQREQVQNTVLYYPNFWRSVTHWFRYRWNPAFNQQSGASVVEAEVINGVCVLLRTAMLRQIGLFDEQLFMYIEDADLSWRARQANWQSHYVPVDSVIHVQKSVGYESTGLVNFLLKRNAVYFLHKHGQRFAAYGYFGVSLVLFALRTGLLGWRTSVNAHLHWLRRFMRAGSNVLWGKRLTAKFGPPLAPPW